MLPDNPRDQKFFLGVLAALAAGGLFYLYLYSPRGEELVEMEDRVAQIEHHNRQAQASAGEVEELQSQLDESEELFGALERLVPSEAEVPVVYEAIASETQSLGLELMSVTPNQAAADSASPYLRQNWDMAVEGEYHAVGDLLARVASFRRIVRPEVTEIRPTGETPSGRQQVQASFDLETFVLPPETDDESQETESQENESQENEGADQ